MRELLAALVTGATTFLASQTFAAEPPGRLDCGKPANAAEARICADATLVGLHNTMLQHYRSVERRIRPRSDVASFVADQARWTERRNTCRATACLVAAYRQRIETLESYAVIRDD